jgi:hypothetical protein
VAIIKPPTAKEIDKLTRPVALELGKLCIAWNRLHEKLSNLFESIVDTKTREVPKAIWHSSKSDLAQREMILAASGERFKRDAIKRTDIACLIGQIGALSNGRNDAIHAPFGAITDTQGTKIVALGFPISMSNRSIKLQNKDLAEDFKRQRIRIDQFAKLTKTLCLALHPSGRFPWPHKHPLLSKARKTRSNAR